MKWSVFELFFFSFLVVLMVQPKQNLLKYVILDKYKYATITEVQHWCIKTKCLYKQSST